MKTNKSHKDNLTNLHKDKLGMEIPEDFFANSKKEILNSVFETEKPKQKLVWLRPVVAYPIAASLVIALAITFWINKNDSQIDTKVVDTEDIILLDLVGFEDDILVSSLFVEDTEMDEFLNNYIVDEILIEVDKQEQEIDDLIINSLFVEDSLIDGYIDENLLENVFL